MASHGLVGGPIGPKHRWKFIHPLASSLFQTLFQYGLDYLVYGFHLSVGFRVSNRCKLLLNAIFLTKFFELLAFELSSIVCNDGPWKARTAYDISYDEINNLLSGYCGQRLCFFPFGKVVDRNYCIFRSTFGYG